MMFHCAKPHARGHRAARCLIFMAEVVRGGGIGTLSTHSCFPSSKFNGQAYDACPLMK